MSHHTIDTTMRLSVLIHLALLTQLLALGCHRDTKALPISSVPTVTTDGSPTESNTDLATRMARLSASDQKVLKELLIEPRSAASGAEARLVRIADELCRLTLAQSEELGATLDADHAGNASEFSLVPYQRQQRALDQIRQIQARISRSVSFPTDLVGGNIRSVDRDFPWLKNRTGERINEIVELSLTCEPDDLGLVPTDISDGDMKVVAALTGLQKLDLRMSRVGDVGLAHLSELPQLQSLDLSDTRVSDAGLQHLAGLPELSRLVLERTNITGPGIGHLADCPSLTSLKLTNDRSAALDLRSLNQLELLEELTINGVGSLDLHDLPNLVKVMVSVTGSTGQESGLRLANMPALETVHVSLHGSQSSRLEIENLPEILRLGIRVESGTLPCEQIGRLTNVRELSIEGIRGRNFSEGDVKHLAKLRNLTRLTLSGNLDPGCVRHLENLTALRQLAFGGEVGDAELSHLKRLAILQELSVWGVHGTGDGFDVLQQMPKLKLLTITKSDLDSLKIARLPSLQSFSAGHCRFRTLDVTSLPSLRTLNLRQLTTKAVAIADLPKAAWMSVSLIQTDEIQQFSLREMPALQTLMLGPITLDGSIENLPCVANLDDRLLAEIATFAKLESLNIRHSAVTDAGLKQVLDMPKLTSFEISGPSLTPEAKRQVRAAISKRSRPR